MDLPADKAKLLKSYDDQKKWELILDEVSTTFIFVIFIVFIIIIIIIIIREK